jgi:Mycothiol maleylpyruvate isomerase N-terminal domain
VTEGQTATQRLVEELRDERDAFFRTLDTFAPGSLTTPGLIGEWSARELIAHLGYWTGHATEVIHAAEQGRIEEIGAGEPSVDEVNATVARVARTTELATVRTREAASVEALVERLLLLDAALLGARLPDGATLEEGIREDGAAHYREHAADLRRVLEARPHG